MPFQLCFVNQVFNENPGYWIGEWRAVCGRAGVRAGWWAYPKWRQTVVSAQ